jgi:hypothetical protein
MLDNTSIQRSAWRIAILLGMMAVLLYVFGQWAESELEARFQAQEKQEAIALAQAQIASIEKLMLRGDATFTKAWFSRMEEVIDVRDISIHRRDGTLAFVDQKTIEKVNTYMGEQRFHRVSPKPPAEVHDDAASVAKAAAGETVVIHQGDGEVTLFMPIQSKESCLRCHGYDENLVRGVYHVKLVTWPASARMAYLRDQSLVPLASFILLWLLDV